MKQFIQTLQDFFSINGGYAILKSNIWSSIFQSTIKPLSMTSVLHSIISFFSIEKEYSILPGNIWCYFPVYKGPGEHGPFVVRLSSLVFLFSWNLFFPEHFFSFWFCCIHSCVQIKSAYSFLSFSNRIALQLEKQQHWHKLFFI